MMMMTVWKCSSLFVGACLFLGRLRVLLQLRQKWRHLRICFLVFVTFSIWFCSCVCVIVFSFSWVFIVWGIQERFLMHCQMESIHHRLTESDGISFAVGVGRQVVPHWWWPELMVIHFQSSLQYVIITFDGLPNLRSYFHHRLPLSSWLFGFSAQPGFAVGSLYLGCQVVLHR